MHLAQLQIPPAPLLRKGEWFKGSSQATARQCLTPLKLRLIPNNQRRPVGGIGHNVRDGLCIVRKPELGMSVLRFVTDDGGKLMCHRFPGECRDRILANGSLCRKNLVTILPFHPPQHLFGKNHSKAIPLF